MAKQPKKQRVPQPPAESASETLPAPGSRQRWQIESGTRVVYFGSTYEQRATNWPLFSWSPPEASIIRFDDREATEAELARVQSYAANARLREVD
jgi:hypothetical protein